MQHQKRAQSFLFFFFSFFRFSFFFFLFWERVAVPWRRRLVRRGLAGLSQRRRHTRRDPARDSSSSPLPRRLHGLQASFHFFFVAQNRSRATFGDFRQVQRTAMAKDPVRVLVTGAAGAVFLSFFFFFFVASCECLIIAPFLLVFRKLASRFPSPHVFRS